MTVKSNYVIAIATFSGLEDSPSISTNENQNKNQSHYVRVIFPVWVL